MPRLPVIVPSLVLLGDALVLALAVAFGSPQVTLGVTGPAGVVAAAMCELLARRERTERRGHPTDEPWRLDGWAALVATLGVLGLSASVGPEASKIAWLLVLLVAGLGFAGLSNLAPRPRA